MARSHRIVAAIYAGRTTNSDLPGDIFGSDLQKLWRLRRGARCRDRLSGPRRLAPSRGSTAARDVAIGERWTYPKHRTMAEAIADQAMAPSRFSPLICGIGGICVSARCS